MKRDHAYVTHDISPIGGEIKMRPEDFFVEEIPAYEPCGHGEHLYLFVQKTGITTPDLAAAIANHFDVPSSAVGYAGMKDKWAVTRQMISVYLPGKDQQQFGAVNIEGVDVLHTGRHTNKLRRGHLRANRFVIRIRSVDPARAVDAGRVLSRLAAEGMPNRFGEQRFGGRNNADEHGRLLLLGDARGFLDSLLSPSVSEHDPQAQAREAYAQGRWGDALESMPRDMRAERRSLATLARGASPAQAARTIDRTMRRLFVSAFQSRVFNIVLDNRLAAGTASTVGVGDLAFRHDNGSVFRVTADEDHDALRKRAASLEISPSGPMWGPKMTIADGDVGRLEAEALAATGVCMDDFRKSRLAGGASKLGQRRALVVPLTDPRCEGGADEFSPYIQCGFQLPKGSYATVALDEIMKRNMVLPTE
ncbi:MAG: tRNA pseudouridine(13) synthase TruD [Phycisphaerales bacterium]|nr:tRNA pseudouridine(13) synthase TruD [Phycisphaerales bacterium]